MQNKNLACAIGDNSVRKKIYHEIDHCYRNNTILHCSTKDSRFSEVEDGTVNLEQRCLNEKITIGNQSDMNIASASEQERLKEDFSLRSPKFTLASKIILRKGVQVDFEAFIILNVTRGSNSFMGA